MSVSRARLRRRISRLWARSARQKLKAGHAEFKSLDAAGKRRYIILRVLAVVLAAVSIMLFIKELIVVPTLVIIVAVALWLAASPKSYNAAVSGVKMLSCPAELTVEKLAGDIAALDSPLGTPYLARIKFVPGKSLVFGPDSEGEYLYIYKTRRARRSISRRTPRARS